MVFFLMIFEIPFILYRIRTVERLVILPLCGLPYTIYTFYTAEKCPLAANSSTLYRYNETVLYKTVLY